jgi:formylglycine-generating enzyme required for sulfatase activity
LSYFARGCAAVLAVPLNLALGQTKPFSYENAHEFFAAGDWDGDGRADVVLVDKASGKFRLGYQLTAGTLSWVDCRVSGMKDVSGFSLGHLLDTNHDALLFASPNEPTLNVLDASSPTTPIRPVAIPFIAALGPNTVAALDVGGEGRTPLTDFYVASIFNAPPEANQATLLRNDRSEYAKVGEGPLAGPATRANILPGAHDWLGEIVTTEDETKFLVENLGSGSPAVVGSLTVPAGSEYAVAKFGGTPVTEVILYKPGETKLKVRGLKETSPSKVELAEVGVFDMGQPVQRVIALGAGAEANLFVILGNGDEGALYAFDGTQAPVRKQVLAVTNEVWTFAVSLPGGLVALSQTPEGKFSTRYRTYSQSGSKLVPGPWGSLPSLADNDNITIPEIHERIASRQEAKSESEMKPYTNAIPGTEVTYAMVPIPGGEFVMGSPDSEKARNADEGPQHRVKIDPFWMQQCEVTWNEYELFMYPDEERRMRGTIPSDSGGDKLADAVTHPSKPYVEMSFGMGKDGFPAISMTQHAANKYCQWLSAKTGHFYRLPTEAEWEYACRAGSTTAYFFGDDPAKLGEYAWFEQNSDFKYQKVGKKKPNPWGLYDIYGNVVEWVLDQYDPEYYKTGSKGTSAEPWNKATKPYPLAARGGSWDDEAPRCRSAARRGSDRSWKMQDPQLPKSLWYFSDAQFVGFRIVRPLKVPKPEEMQKYWTSGVERD